MLRRDERSMAEEIETTVGGSKKKKSRIIIVVGIVVFFLAVAAGAFVMLKGNIFGMPEKSPEEKVACLTFDSIQVNLADSDTIHYLSTSVVIEYDKNKRLGAEMTEKSYRLKDSIIEVLRGKKVSDLDMGEDIDQLKKQMLDEVNRNLTSGKAKSIYFEEFIIQ